jgi:hypothetical protein
MNDWQFLAMGLVWLVVAIALLAYPRQCQSMSRRFEERKSVVPFPPIAGVPLWTVRLFGIVSATGAALFFAFFLDNSMDFETCAFDFYILSSAF